MKTANLCKFRRLCFLLLCYTYCTTCSTYKAYLHAQLHTCCVHVTCMLHALYIAQHNNACAKKKCSHQQQRLHSLATNNSAKLQRAIGIVRHFVNNVRQFMHTNFKRTCKLHAPVAVHYSRLHKMLFSCDYTCAILVSKHFPCCVALHIQLQQLVSFQVKPRVLLFCSWLCCCCRWHCFVLHFSLFLILVGHYLLSKVALIFYGKVIAVSMCR